MEQYIPKSVLVAEIERLVNNYDKALDYEAALEDVRNFIDSLEVKESTEIQHDNDMCKENGNSLTKEPVSEELEEACEQLAENARKHKAETSSPFFSQTDYKQGVMDGAKWQKEQEYTCYEEAFEDGAKWKVENLWKPADGDDLPEYEREVVVFIQDFPDDAEMMRVAIAHRPNPDGWDGKSIATGEVKHYTPKTYDKGGWNIPDIKWWLDCSTPKEIEL